MTREHSHHHHHHHHKKDGATLFKESSFRSIERRRFIGKWLKIILYVVAVIMFVAVIYVYKFSNI